ncbi:MAG: hypothetical protein MJ231_07210 [bacterium]|nr:hypothetical protein [bacterium]
MNTGFYKDLDTNFQMACELSEKEYSHNELIGLLKNGNIPEKQIAALRLDSVDTTSELAVLLDNLTGCDGKIREAVALKIYTCLNSNNQFRELFFKKNVEPLATILANATIDINANVCRLVVDSMSIIKGNQVFDNLYIKNILTFIKEAYIDLDKIIFRDKKYTINKILFKLYWCLEALKIYAEDVDKNILSLILLRASEVREYTIREKAAQIVVKLDGFEDLKNKLKNDENYYVRYVFK